MGCNSNDFQKFLLYAGRDWGKWLKAGGKKLLHPPPKRHYNQPMEIKISISPQENHRTAPLRLHLWVWSSQYAFTEESFWPTSGTDLYGGGWTEDPQRLLDTSVILWFLWSSSQSLWNIVPCYFGSLYQSQSCMCQKIVSEMLKLSLINSKVVERI